MKINEIFKKWCKVVFFTGSGNFWFGDDLNEKSILYKIYSITIYGLYVIMTILEIMAMLFGDLVEDDKNDCYALTICHVIILTKLFMIMANKRVIKTFLSDLEKASQIHEDKSIIKKNYHDIKITIAAYILGLYITVFCYIAQGLRKTFQGENFVVIITIYPTNEDPSILACCFRICTTILLATLMLTTTFSADGFVIVCLIIIKYKFITLLNYLEKLSEEMKLTLETNAELACKKLNDGLIEGIAMHREILRLTHVLEEQFSPIIGIHFGQTIGSAVTILLQVMLLDEFTVIVAVKAAFFAITVHLLLGIFLCSAGEITYQSSLLPEAVFYSGWHLCQSRSPLYRDTRRLVVFAMAQAQRPLAIRAFKMIDLTYANFLQVLKTTYSIFALLHSQYQ